MLRSLLLSATLLTAALTFGQADHSKKSHEDKNTVRHAFVHAGHWMNHHVNPPTKDRHHYPANKNHDRSVHHSTMHAEHWLDHHVSAPHKHKPK